jgi:hypothetical protein
MSRQRDHARQPTPLVRACRRAVEEAAAPYWAAHSEGNGVAKQRSLHDLRIADPDRHSRLLTAIADLDRACARERPDEIAATSAALVVNWQGVVASMRGAK